MSKKEQTHFIIALRNLYEQEQKISVYDNYLKYIEWLEVRLIGVIVSNNQSQPSNTTPSDDVAAGHGAC